jgi:acyl carrier protein|tara:strand:- start:152 stop:406 length:255 start_codon:yes stop_codon:yes gene_type:complete
MDNKILKDNIIKIAADIFSVEHSEIKLSSKQEDFENWDSMGHLNLIMSIEEKLNVKFRSTDVMEMQSVNDIVIKIEELSITHFD